MTPHYADDWLTVYHGDSRAVMAELEPESVHCVVTSPPYWGLRDYGTATWVGGDEACDHLVPATTLERVAGHASTLVGTTTSQKASESGRRNRRSCDRCGAVRHDSQLGLEPTPEAYVASMVEVFREVRRVLRSDGTVWLNLGDSYVGAPVGSFNGGGFKDKSAATGGRDLSGVATSGTLDKTKATGLKPKDLVGIPWRVAFALQADGWYLRSDIIWSKPNPMPESVTDRPTKSHEYLFLLSKSPRYYFDADAVREDAKPESSERYAAGYNAFGVGQFNGSPTDKRGPKVIAAETLAHLTGRNIRSVWTIATAPYPGAHFATFPPKLVEPCIKAGCPEGGTVLDPFAGSGTTGMVAQSLSRRAVLIDLSMDYLGQLMERNRDIPLGLEIA